MSKHPPTTRHFPLAVVLAVAEALVDSGRHRRRRRRRVYIVITEHGPVLLP